MPTEIGLASPMRSGLMSIGFLDRRAALFVLAMAAGMALYSGFAAVPSTPGAEVALDG